MELCSDHIIAKSIQIADKRPLLHNDGENGMGPARMLVHQCASCCAEHGTILQASVQASTSSCTTLLS